MRLDADDTATLSRELAWLCKREGFIQRRLTHAPVVDEVLRGSGEDSFDRLRFRFISAIHTLPDEQAALLLDVYGLSNDTADMTSLLERRRVHGAKIDRKIDTVASREQSALSLLHSRLIMGRYAQAPLVLDVPEMHGGIVYEETNTLIVVRDRRWEATYEQYRFVNMAGELDYVTVTRSYDGTCKPDRNGDFAVNTRPVQGAGWNDHFWHLNADHTHREPMPDAQRFDLRFRITPPEGADEPGAITLASRAFHERSLLATIRVGFTGEQPNSIWRFINASPYARPATADQYNTVELDERATATLVVRDVHGGLFSGFGWEW